MNNHSSKKKLQITLLQNSLTEHIIFTHTHTNETSKLYDCSFLLFYIQS